MAVGARLTGVSNEYLDSGAWSAPDFSGGFDAICRVALDDWNTGNKWLVMYGGYTSNKSFRFGIVDNDFYVLTSTDGADSITYQTTTGAGLTNGDEQWVRALVVPGGTNGTVYFYKGGTGDTPSWSLHESGTLTGLTTVFSPASTSYVGALTATTGNTAGVFHEVQIWEGDSTSGGTLVGEWSAPHTGTRYRDSAGIVWTLNGSAYSTVITS